jgi:hypothetical protein
MTDRKAVAAMAAHRFLNQNKTSLLIMERNRREGRNRFAVDFTTSTPPQRSREARQRWAGGRNRFAV